MKFSLMRNIDGWVGVPLCWLVAHISSQRSSPPPPANKVHSILIVKFLGFGTILLSMPLVRALRQRYPSARITFLTFHSNRDILDMLSPVDRVLTVNGRRFTGVVLQGIRQALRLRREGVDICINLEFFSCYAMLLCFLIRARYSMAYSGIMESRSRVFNGLISYEQKTHITEKMLTFAAALSAETRGWETEHPCLNAEAGRRIHSLLVELPSRPGPTVAVYISSNDKAPKRGWPFELNAEVIRWLLNAKGARVLLIGGPADARAISSFARSFGNPTGCHDLSGRLSLRELASLLAACDLFLGNDGGPFHLAVAVGTKTVSLFGPESPDVYGPPRDGRHIALYSARPCSPCLNVYTHKNSRCIENRCMTDITAEMVIEAVDSILGKDTHSPLRGSPPRKPREAGR